MMSKSTHVDITCPDQGLMKIDPVCGTHRLSQPKPKIKVNDDSY